MATVIQEGKMSAPTQGGLFQGKIFWLSQRVPQRSYIVQQIRANGGIIVIGEKDAEICLVDHLKDPPTSETVYSYEYVTKSLKEKKLEDLESHRVAPKRRQETGSTKPKGLRGRNFFTQEEDEILLRALCKPGVKLSGNAVYNELAEAYPNHTMHSWRGRWINHFSKLMVNGPIAPPIRRQVEDKDKHQKNEDREQIGTKRNRENFTEEDETILKKWTPILLDDPYEINTYEMLSRKHPQHPPKEWRIYFTKVMLPKMKQKKAPEKPDAEPNRSPTGSRSTHRDPEDKKQPIASSSKDKTPSKAKKEIKDNFEPTTSSPDVRPRKQPPTPSANSPIRTVDIRTRPNNTTLESTSKDRSKPPTVHERRKTVSSSPSHRQATPTGRVASATPSKAPLSAIPLSTVKSQKPIDQIPRWRAEIRGNPATEDTDTGSIPPSSPPKLPSSPKQTTKKRKRDSNATLEQLKKSRNTDETASIPESDSPPRSRVLSPELLGSDGHQLASSPLLPKNKKKPKYTEMSTQAIYDHSDDDPSLEFPEIEIPGTSSPPPLPQVSPPPPRQRKLSTPTKLPAPTPGSASKSPPLSPSKDDPDGIKGMNTFLTYCQQKYKTSDRQVIYAIERASGLKGLVELVLQSIVDNKPLPTHVPGVWSEEEDKVLMGCNSREMVKLQEKKGAEHMEKRMDFLNLWNMA